MDALDVLVWDCDEDVHSCEYKVVLWKKFARKEFAEEVSIPELVETKADQFRKSYLAWIYEFGNQTIRSRKLVEHLQIRPGLSYWWMTLLVEKCNYSKSPQIEDAIRLFAFWDWASNVSIFRLKLVSSNERLAECFRSWCAQSEIKFEWERTFKFDISHKVAAVFPVWPKALAWLMFYVISRWPFLGNAKGLWRNTHATTTFISYLFNLEPDSARIGKYESRYWADLPERLARDGVCTNWLHLYVKDKLVPSANQAAQTVRRFNCTGSDMQTHVTIDTFLSIKIVIKVLYDWGKIAVKGMLLKRHLGLISSKKTYLWPLFSREWEESLSGRVAIGNVLNLNLLESAMQQLPKQRIGVYLQENQSWESALIYAWKSAGHGRFIGVPHSTVRFWDMRYYFDAREYDKSLDHASLPLPDSVAVNGAAAKDAYISAGYPSKNLVMVEALRYMHLQNSNSKIEKRVIKSDNAIRLLVLGEYMYEPTYLMLNILRAAQEISEITIIITIKPHPACPIYQETIPGLNFELSQRPIHELLANCDIAYTSNVTSAAVDAYCAGVPVISVLDPKRLNLSPLRGCENVHYVSTANELKNAFAFLIKTPTKLDARGNNYFKIDEALPRWRNLLR